MSSTLHALKPRAMNSFMAALRMALRVERRGNLFPLAAFLVRSTSKFSDSSSYATDLAREIRGE
jgi:hypothetical protein